MEAVWDDRGQPVRENLGRPIDIEARFDDVVEDLRRFRGNMIGAPYEVPELSRKCEPVLDKVYCMATWTELMPTDGTHVEVVQGMTSAADAVTGKEIDDARKLRKALLANERQTARLKDRAYDRMTQAAEIKVHLGSEAANPGETG